MTLNSQPPPPPELSVQAEALRAAFPRYKFVLIDGSIEVTRRDDTAKVPGWLLISSDAKKIWYELSRAS